MLRVGLTGGIASGKSTVGEMFVALGAYLVQADEIAHRLMQPGEPVYQQVVEHFGRGILDPDGRINRSRLAEAAFGSSGKADGSRASRIDELNRIVHPAVINKQTEWMDELGRRLPDAVAMVEAALILEAGAVKTFDRLIVVTCRPEQRIARWAHRLKVDEDTARREVARRMAAQLSDQEKIKAADYVIDNSGSLDETRERVQEIFAQLWPAASGRREAQGQVVRQLHDSKDVSEMLAAPKAVLFIGVDWSNYARDGREVVDAAMVQTTNLGVSWWFSDVTSVVSPASQAVKQYLRRQEQRGVVKLFPNVGIGNGSVLWIRAGEIVDFASNAALLGTAGLVRRTHDVFE